MPIALPSNRPRERFYRGGVRITRFRGEAPAAAREPEDWIASTTTIRGESDLGLTVLPDGRMLRDAIAADPVAWLGAAHVERWGADARLLVKLLDAGQRLPVHAHPHDDFAAAHLGRPHGKAEAWYILEGGVVHVGLRQEAGAAVLADLVSRQDSEGLLSLLHEIEVAPGDVVWVPPGELHAIGAGVLLLELQQPEDLSILLEWRGYELDATDVWHLGLGSDLALSAVSTVRRSEPEIASLVHRAPRTGSVFPAEADRYFRLERVDVDGATGIAAGFSVVVATDGRMEVGGEAVHRGSVLLVAADEGEVVVDGRGELLIARPPAP
ncbi:class I mannose-6-phosphate isomerase [Microbacterium natoriense]|uniref:carbohydrate kinase n=1 Tax=Microbacterium natoriense TaxID=284570 RepID=UPI0031CE8EA2